MRIPCSAVCCRVRCLSWPENRASEYDDRVRVKLPGEEVEPRGGSKAVLRGLRVRIQRWVWHTRVREQLLLWREGRRSRLIWQLSLETKRREDNRTTERFNREERKWSRLLMFSCPITLPPPSSMSEEDEDEEAFFFSWAMSFQLSDCCLGLFFTVSMTRHAV